MCSLKGSSTNFTHYSVFTGLGEHYYIYEKKRIKHFMAPEEAAWNLINCLQWCHLVAKLGCGNYKFWKAVQHCIPITLLDCTKFKINRRFIPYILIHYQNLVPTLHNAVLIPVSNLCYHAVWNWGVDTESFTGIHPVFIRFYLLYVKWYWTDY